MREKKFNCEECGKLFFNKRNLTTHLQIHNGKTFSCEKCSKQFSQKKNLKSHMLVHTRVYKFGCEVCGRTFKWKRNLIRHVLVHKGSIPDNILQHPSLEYPTQQTEGHKEVLIDINSLVMSSTERSLS